jgi:hypothetical protein
MTTEHNAGPLHYPEALRLADIIGGNCADELRRQHAEIEQSKAQVFLQMKWKTDAQNENERLLEINAELLEALRTALDASWNGPLPDYAREEARAAIAKAEKVKP